MQDDEQYGDGAKAIQGGDVTFDASGGLHGGDAGERRLQGGLTASGGVIAR